MTQNHWRVVAILGGLALGFFMTRTVAGWTSYATNLYNSGRTTGTPAA